MSKDTVIHYENPAIEIVNDQLTTFLRESAQKMLKSAIQAEVNEFLEQHQSLQLPDGRQRVVKNGYLPEREIQTGVGGINVAVPRTRDRGTSQDKLNYISQLIPKYMRRTVTLDVMLPILYLKGISTNDFAQVLTPMLGEGAKSISEKVIRQLKSAWFDDFQAWQKRDLSDKRYVYWWVDGIYVQARMESEKTCLFVIVGADEHGNKSLVALSDGIRESKASWLDLLLTLKQKGLAFSPHVAVGDGALGFWGALNEVYPEAKHQRCWVHKTANILDKLPKSQRESAKSKVHDIYMAPTKKDALDAYDNFIGCYQLKYPRATECLAKDKEALLTFYGFPAEHWIHLRTTNPIESTFATVRHRTKKSKNCFSRNTIVACVFKLCLEAEKRWKKLRGAQRIADVINLVEFKDGLPVDKKEEKQEDVDAQSQRLVAA